MSDKLDKFVDYVCLMERESFLIKRVINDKVSLSYGVESLLKLSRAYELDMSYHTVKTKNDDVVKTRFLQCASYNLLAMQLLVSPCQTKQFSIHEEEVYYGFCLSFLLSNLEEDRIIFNKLVLEPISTSYPSWNFIKLLYAKSQNITLTDEDKIYDTLLLPYKTILSDMYSSNTQKMYLFINLLCDTYLEIENKNKFPYEILTWLKLREKAGLKNPKTFSHPLMNTPIAKMFLNIKEPLPKPTELPYAKELLEKLKEQCPDVEIPEWLDAEDGSIPIKEESTPPQDNTIIPDDFMN